MDKSDKIYKFAKIIRIITVAPIMAALALSILSILRPDIFQNIWNYIWSIVFLTIFPLAAYPIQRFIPFLYKKGREGQRNVAIIMAVLGYLCSIITAIFFDLSKNLLIIYLAYFISGIGIFVFNKIFKIRASGHACGVVGPLSILIYFVGIKAFWGLFILIFVYWACLKMKRHTVLQLLLGSIIPIVSLMGAILLANI